MAKQSALDRAVAMFEAERDELKQRIAFLESAIQRLRQQQVGARAKKASAPKPRTATAAQTSAVPS
jgi:peptidoglycan hydrolase CwlO-like protein